MNKCAPFLLLLLTGCAVSTAVDTSPHLVSVTSFSQPAVVLSPSGSVSVVDWASFAWDDPNSPPASSFNLYYGSTFPHEYDQVIPVASPTVIVSNLAPGTTYALWVTAVGTNGAESDFSPEYDYVMPTNLDMSFSFNLPATTTSVQSSTDLMSWQACNARPLSNGTWRIAIDPDFPIGFYRGVAVSSP